MGTTGRGIRRFLSVGEKERGKMLLTLEGKYHHPACLMTVIVAID